MLGSHSSMGCSKGFELVFELMLVLPGLTLTMSLDHVAVNKNLEGWRIMSLQ